MDQVDTGEVTVQEVPKQSSYAPEVSDNNAPLTNIVSPDELRAMPIGMRIIFDDRALARFYKMAENMAESGLFGKHLDKQPEACFAVVRMALSWNMDPFQVAQSTYAPAKGKIGIEGKLAVAAMLGSRKVKSIKYEHGGDWSQVAGKFEMVSGGKWPDGKEKGKKAEARYTAEDEQGLYVIATATMHDGIEISTPEVYLNACHPRNSTLWAANPRRQIMYVADRMLAQLCAGDVLMGVHFDVGMLREFEEDREPIDITPPKAVDPSQEGIVGNGEVQPGTEPGVEEAWRGRATPLGRGDSSSKEEEKPERASSEKVKVQWRGKVLGKTKFLRDIKFGIEDHEEFAGLTALGREVGEAKETADGDAPRMWEEIDQLFEAAYSEYEDEDEEPHDPDTGEVVDDDDEDLT